MNSWQNNPIDTRAKWGVAIEDLVEPGMELWLVPHHMRFQPELSFSLREKLLPHAEEIEGMYGSRKWDPKAPLIIDRSYKELYELSRDLDIRFFESFSFDELNKMVFNDFIMSTISQAIQDPGTEYPERFTRRLPEPVEFTGKLRNSMFQLGVRPLDWNAMVAAHESIPRFRFGKEFQLRFDHTQRYHRWGPAHHVQERLWNREPTHDDEYEYQYFNDNLLYIDGVFAYLVYWQGHHVLTLGFSVGGAGEILVNQIQVRSPKGNRWLYGLPEGLLNYTIDRFYRHFTENYGLDVYLIQPTSVLRLIQHQYKEGVLLDESLLRRIADFYGQPLTRYQRGPTFQAGGWFYDQILSK